MSLTQVHIDAICGPLPGATKAEPPELISWKVGGKMFACFGSQDGADGVSVKCADADTAAMLIDSTPAIKAKYFHKSWVRLPFASTSLDEATHRIQTSYEIIAKSLPKALRP